MHVWLDKMRSALQQLAVLCIVETLFRDPKFAFDSLQLVALAVTKAGLLSEFGFKIFIVIFQISLIKAFFHKLST